jgi:hypothetical protein
VSFYLDKIKKFWYNIKKEIKEKNNMANLAFSKLGLKKNQEEITLKFNE